MKLKTIYFILLPIILFSCENRGEFIKEISVKPTVKSIKNNIELLNDSLKISIKSPTKTLLFDLEIEGNNVEKTVNYQIVNPSGALLINGLNQNILVGSGNVSLKNGKHTVSYSPTMLGKAILYFNVNDNIGNTVSNKIEITSFDNITPIAKLKATKVIDANMPLTYTISASESVDGDAKFGGSIQAYQFIIEGKTFPLQTSPTLMWSFGSPGDYSITVICIDSDNAQSTKTITETIN